MSLPVEPTAVVGTGDEAWFVSASDGSLWHTTKAGSVSTLIHMGGYPVDLTSPEVYGLTWVVLSDQDRVVEVDTKTGAVVASVAVGHSPSSEDKDFLMNQLWVANAGDDTITRIDPTRRVVTGAAQVGHQPVDIAFAGGDVWVANAGDDSVTVVDASNLKRIATIRLGHRPTGIAIEVLKSYLLTPTEFKVWVATVDGSVAEIDGPSLRVERTLAVGSQPRAVAAVQHGVLVANEGSNSLSVIDLSGRQIFRGNHNLDAGVDPVSVSWWIDGHIGYFDTVIWVADKTGKTMTVMAGFGAN